LETFVSLVAKTVLVSFVAARYNQRRVAVRREERCRMRRFIGVLTCGLACILAAGAVRAAAQHPSWAYGFTEPPSPGAAAAPAAPAAPAAQAGGGGAAAPAAAPDTTLLRLPGTDRTFTRAQLTSAAGPADWYPGDHPVMPDVVAKGRMGTPVTACSLCHYPNGKGRPENSGVSGLSYEYFVQTMMDFRNDLRHSADPRKANTNRMIAIAKAMTEDEIRESARYFSSMPWTPWIRVMETRTVPKTRIQGGMFLRLDGNETEPIGVRIIEAPENNERTEVLRDPRSGFIAYAPVGSMKTGEALVKTGGSGKTVQCGICHGPNLEGLGPVPGLAGRSPSYVVRQLYDMQVGTRKGTWSALMKPVVEKLTAEDLVAIGAYTASLTPQASVASQ
jgi:cytochrome c553